MLTKSNLRQNGIFLFFFFWVGKWYLVCCDILDLLANNSDTFSSKKIIIIQTLIALSTWKKLIGLGVWDGQIKWNQSSIILFLTTYVPYVATWFSHYPYFYNRSKNYQLRVFIAVLNLKFFFFFFKGTH